MTPRPSVTRQVVFALVFLVIVTLVAVLGSLATIPNTEGWYATVEKAAWSPPNAVFGPVWSALYALIAFAGWLIWRNGYRGSSRNEARNVLTLFGVQMVLNCLWTPVFFAGYPLIGETAWWLALIVIIALIVSVVWLAIQARTFSLMASLIMVPYLLWLTFATSLNVAVIVLN